MNKHLLSLALVAACTLAACSPSGPAPETVTADDAPLDASRPATIANDNPSVGGAPMHADRDIIENAMNSPDRRRDAEQRRDPRRLYKVLMP